MRSLTESIKQISEVARHHALTPTQFRYATRQVRQNLKLVVEKKAQKLPEYLTASEIYALLSLAKSKPTDALLLEFMVFTGLRVFEVVNLKVESIDFEQHVLKVVQGKGKKDRWVPITLNLQSKLLLYLQGRKEGYLFCKRNETKFTTRALQYRITGWLKKLNLPKLLTTHTLRHTFACLCLARGIDIYKLRDLMGHTTVKHTEIYAKLEIGGIRDEFLRLMDVRLN
jgi:integrase/recombinase XerD